MEPKQRTNERPTNPRPTDSKKQKKIQDMVQIARLLLSPTDLYTTLPLDPCSARSPSLSAPPFSYSPPAAASCYSHSFALVSFYSKMGRHLQRTTGGVCCPLCTPPPHGYACLASGAGPWMPVFLQVAARVLPWHAHGLRLLQWKGREKKKTEREVPTTTSSQSPFVFSPPSTKGIH